MTSRIRCRLLGIAALVLPMASTSAETLTNETYRLELREDGAIQVTTGQEKPVRLTPSFTVLYSAKEPGYHRNNSNYPLAPRTSLRWAKYQQPVDDLNRWLKEEMGLAVRVTEDAKGSRTWDYGPGRLKVTGQYAQGTTNPFLAGERFDLLPQKTLLDGRTMRWEFAPSPEFTLVAELTLPAGEGDPEISYTLTAVKPGYYAVAFTGAPAVDEKAALSVPQLATGRGGKQFNHVVAEVTEKLPRAHVSDGRQNFLVVAHPDSVPFDRETCGFQDLAFRHDDPQGTGAADPRDFRPGDGRGILQDGRPGNTGVSSCFSSRGRGTGRPPTAMWRKASTASATNGITPARVPSMRPSRASGIIWSIATGRTMPCGTPSRSTTTTGRTSRGSSSRSRPCTA